MVNKTEKSVEFTKGIFSTHNLSLSVWNNRWCYICLLHKIGLQISSERTSRVCGRSLTLASKCFLLIFIDAALINNFVFFSRKSESAENPEAGWLVFLMSLRVGLFCVKTTVLNLIIQNVMHFLFYPGGWLIKHRHAIYAWNSMGITV